MLEIKFFQFVEIENCAIFHRFLFQGRFKHSNLNSGTSKCIGADLVMKLLGNYCRNKDIRTSIRVGVVGLSTLGKFCLFLEQFQDSRMWAKAV